MPDVAAALPRWQGKTLWARDRAAPLREFVRTEAASALMLVAGIVVAIIWANVSDASYESFWHTRFYLGVGSAGITQDLRTWLNSGLMTLFFLVVGLEARRELDLGDLRERRRFILPIAANIGSTARRRSRRSPTSSSRLASSPTTRKNSVISPELIQPRRSVASSPPPSFTDSCVVHSDS